MLGTDFPYTDWYPKGKEVIQVDRRSGHIGRRTAVDHAIVGDARLDRRGPARARPRQARPRAPGGRAPGAIASGSSASCIWPTPSYDTRGVVEKVRARFDNPDERIRPEAVAVAVDRHAAADAIFTSDTGMSTVWLSRFVPMRGNRRLHRLLQPGLDGQRDAAGARRPGAATAPAR